MSFIPIDYNKVDIASKLSIEHYFKDSSWFDKINSPYGDRINMNGSERTYENTGIQPMRCTQCKLPFQKLPVFRPRVNNYIHLNRGLFKGIILKKGVCHACK